MSSLMCCTSTRSQKVVGYKEGQKKFLWLDPNRWSGQKTVKKEKVRPHISLQSRVLHFSSEQSCHLKTNELPLGPTLINAASVKICLFYKHTNCQ